MTDYYGFMPLGLALSDKQISDERIGAIWSDIKKQWLTKKPFIVHRQTVYHLLDHCLSCIKRCQYVVGYDQFLESTSHILRCFKASAGGNQCAVEHLPSPRVTPTMRTTLRYILRRHRCWFYEIYSYGCIMEILDRVKQCIEKYKRVYGYFRLTAMTFEAYGQCIEGTTPSYINTH